METMKREIPDSLKAFMGMFQGIMKEGALSLKGKELIALAIGLVVRCEPCIYAHVKKCVEAGATEQLDALWEQAKRQTTTPASQPKQGEQP